MKYKTLCPDCGSVVEEGKYVVLFGYLYNSLIICIFAQEKEIEDGD